jgi:hypothetical protein
VQFGLGVAATAVVVALADVLAAADVVAAATDVLALAVGDAQTAVVVGVGVAELVGAEAELLGCR